MVTLIDAAFEQTKIPQGVLIISEQVWIFFSVLLKIKTVFKKIVNNLQTELKYIKYL